MADDDVDLSLLLPYSNENRWSDLLATMIRCDPSPLVELQWLSERQRDDGIQIVREVSVARAQPEDTDDESLTPRGRRKRNPMDRIDLEVRSADGDRRLVAIECKVLSDLGPDQLPRYKKTHPASKSILLTLPYRTYATELLDEWEYVHWKTAVEPFTRSHNAWVRRTAQAWVSYLQSDDVVSGSIAWNELLPGSANANHDLQRKAAYLCARAGNGFYLGSSNAGGKPLLVLRIPVTGLEGTVVMAEVQDANSRATFTAEDDHVEGAAGVVTFIGIRREYPLGDKIQSYDFEALATLWDVVQRNEVRFPWSQRRAGRKRRGDDNQELVRRWEAGELPAFVGKGYRGNGYCEYGLKTKKGRPDQSLDEISALLGQIGRLSAEIVEALSHKGS